MITVLPFERWHLVWIKPQRGQRVEMSMERAGLLEQFWSFTAIDEQNRVLMCAGVVPGIDGAWWGWALLSVLARCRLLALSRAVLGIMPAAPIEKVRIAVRWEFKQGHAWARLLGFTFARELQRIEGLWCAVYERSARCGH